MTDFTDEMDKLAAGIAKQANVAEKAFGDQIDAFKALMPYYALQKKNGGKEDPDNGLPNFDNFTSSIHATEHANGKREPGVRDRRRNGN